MKKITDKETDIYCIGDTLVFQNTMPSILYYII